MIYRYPPKQNQWGTNCYYPLISVVPVFLASCGRCKWKMYMAKGLWRFAVPGDRFCVRTSGGFTMTLAWPAAPRPSQAEGVVVVIGNHLNFDKGCFLAGCYQFIQKFIIFFWSRRSLRMANNVYRKSTIDFGHSAGTPCAKKLPVSLGVRVTTLGLSVSTLWSRVDPVVSQTR